MYTVSDTPTADPTGAVAGFADATGRFLPLVCTLNATKVTDTVRPAARRRPRRSFDAARAGRRRRAPAALVLLPYLDGERTPNRPDATGTITGLRTDVDAASRLARAAVEGVVCGLLDGLDALRVGGVTVRPADGIAAARRRRAPARGPAGARRPRALLRSIVPRGEPVATGACVQAAAVLQQTPPDEVAVAWDLGTGSSIEPDEDVDTRAMRSAYVELRDRYYATS